MVGDWSEYMEYMVTVGMGGPVNTVIVNVAVVFDGTDHTEVLADYTGKGWDCEYSDGGW